MKFLAIALIAAVTVNCFVKTVNGKPSPDTLAKPYIDTLLPPFKDVQDSSKDASTKINVTAKATPATVTRTTKKPIKNDAKNILPVLSIETLLPPLFEAKIEKKKTTTTKTTTTKRPTTTTTKPTTTAARHTTRATLKPSNLKVPDLLSNSLASPLFGNDTVNVKAGKISTATTARTTTSVQKPIKTSTKVYHQQHTQHSKDQNDIHNKTSQKQQPKHLPANAAGNEVKNYKKLAAAINKANDKYIAESQTRPKQVSLLSQQKNVKIDTTTERHVAKHVTNNSKYDKKQHNYSFDFYFGSTTPKTPKSGLPTITPFPHRLGR